MPFPMKNFRYDPSSSTYLAKGIGRQGVFGQQSTPHNRSPASSPPRTVRGRSSRARLPAPAISVPYTYMT